MSEDNDDILIASMDENQDELVIHIGKIRKFYNDYKKLETEVKDLRQGLDDIRMHIKNKVRKSFEVDWGISNIRSDRLMTETVVELQIIEELINAVLEEKGE